MGKILAVYSQNVFKEYILPSINNSDYSLILDKALFGLADDIALKMEVIEEKWSFLPDASYRIKKEDTPFENREIHADDLLNVVIKDQLSISVLVCEPACILSAYSKYDLSSIKELSIGKNPENVVRYTFREFVSKKHARIVRENLKWKIVDTSTNGVYVNSERVVGERQLRYGDYINIVGLHLVFLGSILAIDTSNERVVVNEQYLHPFDEDNLQETMALSNAKGKHLYHRAPRSVQKIETEPIVIEAPPAPEKPEQMPLYMTIGPSLTMAFPMLLSCAMMIVSSRSSGGNRGIYMYTGLIMAITTSVIGIIWTLNNQKYHKKRQKEKEVHRFEAYSGYLVRKTQEVKEKYEHNMEAMKSRYLPAKECLAYDQNSLALWNRNSLHFDFLAHRIGMGDVPFQVPIKVPEDKFSLLEDALTDKPRYIFDNYKTLYQVPVTVDLLEHPLIGVVGGDSKAGALQVAYLLSAQLAANNCYTDVKLAYAYDSSSSENKGKWDFVKWLPHIWSEDHQVRFLATNALEASDLFYELTKIFRRREETAEKMANKIYRPHVVLFISDVTLLEGELIEKYILEEHVNYGLTTVLLAKTREELPNNCRYIIENSNAYQGIYDVMAGEEDRMKVSFDEIDGKQLETFARKLSNIEVQETEVGGELPSALSFFDMYHVSRLEDLHVLDRWRKNRIYENIRGLIGQKAGGKDCYLDVHEKYHGPHGLVAGTTGSGKSETLQTYMLSLALNYSPDDVGFFIIDYKGGGMANLFNGLPHLIGQISNLSGNQVHRAMVSIKSENRRRQKIFNDNGVNNINLYTKLYKNGEAAVPVPHLFIIIDEFAELKREEPDFMRELISVAQVGRSLGVHLILATQKPSGTVDDNIWSNSKFRLCLRVQDRQDSNDMLHKPDAAYITQAGRCYLQVGNDEVYELFQSGYSGAAYVEDDCASKTDSVKLISATGKAEIVGGFAKNQQKELQLQHWLELLTVAYQCALRGNEEESRQKTIEQMYCYLEERQIEYPRSTYNDQRLEDFIQLYQRAADAEHVITCMMKIAQTENIKLPQVKEKTQLDAVKEYLAVVAKQNGFTYDLQLWMPVLPEYLYLSELEGYNETAFADGRWKQLPQEWELSAIIGKLDDPRNQQQMPLRISLSEGGHLAVCGTVGSGKSSFLQSFIYSVIGKYTPEYVNLYILDFSSKMLSAFEKAPHVGGIVYEGDDDKIAKLFNMLGQLLADRKKLFHGGNYEQYVKAHGVTVPAVLIVIDNYAAFNEKTDEIYNDMLIQISKEGISHGIYLIISGGGFGRNEIPTRIAENMMNTIALQMTDKFGYADVLRNMKFDVLPETGVKGRGLAYYGTQILEYQTALALPAEDDYQRLEQIEEMCAKMAECYHGRSAKRIPQIPEKPVWYEFAELDEVEECAALPDRIPVGYDANNASVYTLNLRNIYCYLIMGAHRTGKKNFMRIMLEACLNKPDTEIVVMDTAGKAFGVYEEREGVRYMNTDRQIFEYFQNMIPEIQARVAKKKELIAAEYEEDEIFEQMKKEKPYYIFLPDLAAFVHMIETSELEMSGFLQNIWERGSMNNIYFIAALSVEDRSAISGSPLFTKFSNYKKGIHFGGRVTDNPVLNYDYIPYREQNAVQKLGIGMIAGPLFEKETSKIVVPVMRGKRND